MNIRFVHISDTHITPTGRLSRDDGLSQLVEEINAMPYSNRESTCALIDQINALPFEIDFVLHTGDVVHDPQGLEEYVSALDLLAGLRHPVHYLVGNHDRQDGIKRLISHQPVHSDSLDYWFDCGGLDVMCLDSSSHGEGGKGFLKDEQLEWLDARLRSDQEKPAIIALHHNPFYFASEKADEYTLVNGEALHKILVHSRSKLRGVFYGHIHQAVDTYRDGILYSAAMSAYFQFDLWPGVFKSGGIDRHRVVGFNVVTIKDDTTYVRRFGIRLGE
ncbi:MAG: metallophosphoesterase [Aggregatilineales bacterium]